MSIPTLKPVINRTQLKTVKGFYSIHVCITHERITKYIRLKKALKIALNHWNNKGTYNNYVKNTHLLAFETNSEIQQIMDHIFSITKHNYETELSLNDIIKRLNKNLLKGSFNEYLKDYIKNPRQKLDPVTKLRMKTKDNYMLGSKMWISVPESDGL